MRWAAYTWYNGKIKSRFPIPHPLIDLEILKYKLFLGSHVDFIIPTKFCYLRNDGWWLSGKALASHVRGTGIDTSQ